LVAIAPSSPSVLYAAGGPAVSRSDDGGLHWSLLKDFGGAFVTVTSTVPAVDPTDADRVFVGVNDIITNGSGSVWRSIDGGASWEAVLGPLPFVGILAIDPREPHALFSGADVLARSLDGGSTWTDVAGVTSMVVSLTFPASASGVVAAGTSFGGVLVSRDGGAAFAPANSGLSGDALKVLGVAAVAGSPSSLFAATRAGLYRTDDLGGHWQAANAETWFGLLSDPSSASILYALNDGVFKSIDGGVHWSEIDEGLVGNRPMSPGCDPESARSAVPAESVVVDPRDSERVVAVAAGSVYRRPERGGCLVRSDDGLGRTPPPCLHDVDPSALSVDPQQSETLYLGSSQGVYKSTDSGLTWVQRSAGISFANCEADVGRVAVDPASSDVLFVSGQGIFKSENGGDSWTLAQNGFPAGTFPPVSQFAFDPRNTDVVYAATFRLYKTVDGAQLWQPSDQGLPGPVYAVAVDLRNPEVVHAGTPDGLFVSHDAGASWALEGLSGHAVSSVLQNPGFTGIFLALTDAGLFRSTDGGVLWSPLATPFPAGSIHEVAFAPSDPSTVYAATDVGVFRSRDDAASWTLVGISFRAPRTVGRPGL
ncbi:MAG TPA: hypothetical protein VGO79_12865, partial [Thermoanaerobaculia bacterium]